MREQLKRKAATKSPTTSRPALLKQALQQPGVKEAMKVYERSLKVQKAAQPYFLIAGSQEIVSASSSSEPLPW